MGERLWKGIQSNLNPTLVFVRFQMILLFDFYLQIFSKCDFLMLSLKKRYCVIWKQCASTFAWGVFFFQTLSLTLSRRLDTLDAPDSNKRLIFILEHGSLKHIEFSSASTSTLKIHMTSSQINDTFLFHRVLKILMACRILQISIAQCQIEGEIHSFPTMYGKGG